MAYQFAIIGAGIAGLATATGLQRRGHRVTVIEAREDTSSGAGISIWPNALAALDELGLGDAVREAGGRVTAGAMRRRNGTWLRRPAPDRIIKALGEPLVVVQRSVLRDILAGALEPGSIRYGIGTTAVEHGPDGVEVTLADSSVLRADAAVGADGIGSMLARQLNGDLPLRYAGYTAWRGVADYALAADLAGETLGDGAEFGHVPMGRDRTYWFVTQRLPEGQQFVAGELRYLRSRLSDWAEPVPSILAATPEAAVLRNDLYDRATARRWTDGRVVLVGDAAHPMRPHLGQGGCQGIEDAATLVALVDSESDLAAAFGRFESVRRRRVRPLVRESRAIGRVMNLRPAALSAAANQASVLLPEAFVTRHLAGIASRSAFRLP